MVKEGVKAKTLEEVLGELSKDQTPVVNVTKTFTGKPKSYPWGHKKNKKR